jgi:hypothetical protein
MIVAGMIDQDPKNDNLHDFDIAASREHIGIKSGLCLYL